MGGKSTISDRTVKVVYGYILPVCRYMTTKLDFLLTLPHGAGVFSFVISSAFEMEDRLLHPRNGLPLWDISQVEMEALSNDATVLMVEMRGES